MVARSRDKLESLKEELQTKYEVGVVAYPADLTSSTDIEKLHEYLTCTNVAAFSAGPDMSLYYASKSFALSFSEALSEEVKGSGVTDIMLQCAGKL